MFLNYINNFRAFAISFIVLGHTIDVFVWDDNDIERLLRIYISNGSVLFVFIAGYLFQHLSVKFEIKKYFLSKIKNVIVPYLLISIPAIIIFVFLIEREPNYIFDGFYEEPIFIQVLWFYLTGKHLAPLWFIPMITIFFIIAPILLKADLNGKIYYFLPLFIVLSCLVDRGGLPYQAFIHFFSAYLLGMFCSKYKDSLNKVLEKYSILILLSALVYLFGMLEFIYMKGTMTYLNFIQKLLISLLLLGILIRLSDTLNFHFLNILANVSFGIYFLHGYFISGVKLIHERLFGILPSGDIYYFLVAGFTILLVCTLSIIAIKKITGSKSRILIGS